MLTCAPLWCRRNLKRKADEPAEEDEHHGEFDEAQLREHEEFTKVSGFSVCGFSVCPLGHPSRAQHANVWDLKMMRSMQRVMLPLRSAMLSLSVKRWAHFLDPVQLPLSPAPALHILQVKNVERIELGRYEMETWYFSPLPPEFKDCKVGTEHEMRISKRHTAGPCSAPLISCPPRQAVVVQELVSPQAPRCSVPQP